MYNVKRYADECSTQKAGERKENVRIYSFLHITQRYYPQYLASRNKLFREVSKLTFSVSGCTSLQRHVAESDSPHHHHAITSITRTRVRQHISHT